MKRLLVDNAIFLRQSLGGITTWWKVLLEYFENDPYVILQEHSVRKRFWFIPSVKRSDVFISSYLRINLNIKCSNILVIHDTLREDYSNSIFTYLYKFYMRLVLKYSDVIVCISDKTRGDVIRLYSPEVSKLRVIHHGIKFGKGFPSLDGRKYDYIYVGKRSGYKNFTGELNHLANKRLCIVGNKLSQLELLLLDKHNIKYTLVSNVSNAELAKLYSNSKFLYWPSKDEGFGLPILEAIKFGCLPLVQNNQINQEILGVYLKEISSQIHDEDIDFITNLFDYASKRFDVEIMLDSYRRLIHE